VDHRDLDSVEEAKQEITSQIKALEKDSSKLETPISVSLDLQTLRQSDNPEQRSLADVLSALTEVRSSLQGIETRIEAAGSVSVATFRELVDRERYYEAKSHQMLSALKVQLNELLEAWQKDTSHGENATELQREIIKRIEELMLKLADDAMNVRRFFR
jgi:septal ring factor EnvC (AmiA/AmiB activator)